MKMQNKLSILFLVPGLLTISACGKSVESKCQEMTETESKPGKTEAGSGEEMAMMGCLSLAKQMPDAFNREYDAWKVERDKMKKN